MELHENAAIAKKWNKMLKKETNNLNNVKIKNRPDIAFFPSLLDLFFESLDILNNLNQEDDNLLITEEEQGQRIRFCQRFLEFLIDLLSQLPTRRFIRTLLDNKGVLVKCKIKAIEYDNLYLQLLNQFEYYMTFNVDDHTGKF